MQVHGASGLYRSPALVPCEMKVARRTPVSLLACQLDWPALVSRIIISQQSAKNQLKVSVELSFFVLCTAV
jgi:hypothetical protein